VGVFILVGVDCGLSYDVAKFSVLHGTLCLSWRGGVMAEKQSKSRNKYMRDYRKNYGDLMREQIKEWFKVHPDYLKRYCKKWRQENSGYYKERRRRYKSAYLNYERHYRVNHADSIRDYMRSYMRRYRTGEPESAVDI
jgi:hypothetical protein